MTTYTYCAPRQLCDQDRCALLGAIFTVAREQPSFTAADVWQRLAQPERRARCAPARLISGALREARRHRYCEPFEPGQGGMVAEGDEQCHRRPQRRWRSLIFKKGAALKVAA